MLRTLDARDANRDELLRVIRTEGHERFMVHMVDLGQVPQLRRGQPRLGGEEPGVR